MSKQTVTLELEVPEGYEATGEWRHAHADEISLGKNGHTHRHAAASLNYQIILRRIPSPTVTVEFERRALEWLSATFYGKGEDTQSCAGRTARAALEAEADAS